MCGNLNDCVKLNNAIANNNDLAHGLYWSNQCGTAGMSKLTHTLTINYIK